MTTQAEYYHTWYIRHKAERAAYNRRHFQKNRKMIYRAWALNRIERKSFERVRLTSHLVWIVNDAANLIAEIAEPLTTVHVKDIGVLTVQTWKSHVQVRKVLVFGDPKEDLDEEGHELRCPGAAFGFDVDPGRAFLMDGDLSSQGIAASTENYIAFAQHVPQIVDAFAVEEQKMIERLLKSFDMLRHVIGST